MIIYILIIFFLLYFAVIEKTLKIYYFRKIFYFMLILVSGLRYYVGSDYKLYKRLYETFPKDRFSEYLFNFVIIALKKFNLDYQVLIFFISFVTLSLIYIFFSKTNKKLFWIYSFLFIIEGCYFETFNVMRQYLGLSVFLLGILCKKRWIRYLCFYIAVGIHKSIFVLVLSTIIFNSRINKKIGRKIVFLFIILGILNIKFNLINHFYILIYDLLPKSYQAYIYSTHNIGSKIEGSGLGILFRILVFILIFYYSKDKLSTRDNLYLNFYFYGEILYLFSFTSLILRRVSILFTFFSIILLPNIFLKTNDKRKKYIFAFIVIAKIILFIKFLNFELTKQYLIYQII